MHPPADIHLTKGLRAQEVRERLAEDGFNELPSSKHRSILGIAFHVVKEPMFLLLVACGVIYLLLGSRQESFMLLGSIVFVMGITIYQERKTERALEALRDLSSPRALVIREGERLRIPGREVVRDDIFLLSEGDRIPADGYVLSCINLSVDESLLTGESVPVRKRVWKEHERERRPGGDDQPTVYSGSLVATGKAHCRAYATGIRTEIGKIGKALQSLETEHTLLQKEVSKIVQVISIIGAFLCLLVVVLYWLTRGDLLNGFLAGLSLAMAILPEEFPVVLTIFFAIGAWRIAKRGVLTRRIPAMEMLGAATVLCVDKTGTLTLNTMTVERIMADGKSIAHPLSLTELPEAFHSIVEYSILASQKDPFDPMEKAFRHLGEEFLRKTHHLHDDWTLVREYSLSPHLLAMSEVWKSPGGSEFVIAAKGAPEAIVELCHLPEARSELIRKHVEEMATDGLRVLAVAKAHYAGRELPGKQHDFPFEFLGLIGLADPVRPAVPAAILECRDAGIRVIMITGDHPATAASIARQIDLHHKDSMITGQELDAMDDAALKRRIKTVTVFARVVPEQKLRIVQALKEQGEIVAMTGDGVNDAPALKAAHIGVSMGMRGTDVAREASDLVLVDDDFSSIVQAIRMGRRIFDNLRNAMSYLLAIHVPIAGISLIPVALKWPLVLSPVHILFLELIIDPACSIAFEMEPEEPNVMKRPPRNPRTPMFRRRMVLINLFQGFVILMILIGVIASSLSRGLSDDEARTLTFATLVIANVCLILSDRSRTKTILENIRTANTAVWWVAGGALAVLSLVLWIPALRSVFHFSALSLTDIALCVAAGILSIAWFEIAKIMMRNRRFASFIHGILQS